MSDRLREFDRAMTYAETVAVETRDRLLKEGIDPLLIAGATAHHGIFTLVIQKLGPEEQSMICDQLQNFINDMRQTEMTTH